MSGMLLHPAQRPVLSPYSTRRLSPRTFSSYPSPDLGTPPSSTVCPSSSSTSSSFSAAQRRHAMAAAPAATGAAAAAEAAPPPPPYSQLSVPVYSLATVGLDGGSPTMNLVIYASPVSLTPRHYAIGLYQNTLSRENMLATRRGVLQILGEQHAQLFQLLGKTSGRQVDKLAKLAELGFATRTVAGIPTLADCVGYMELEFAAEPFNAGDHEVAICRVVGYETVAKEARPLTTGYLREVGLY